MAETKKYISKAGKQLVKILMFSMYNDQRIIYREYVQNAYDAINMAVRQGVLHAVKDGIVSINIDPENRQIKIKDNGCGISTSVAEETLLNIADSQKDGETSAGQYGIGRLTGAGYCKWLTFRTSAKGEDKASIIIFDVDEANRLLHDSTVKLSATEVIDAITTVKYEDEESEAHYFEVIMDGVHEEYGDLLDSEVIIKYLQEVAPVDYTIEFKNCHMNHSLEENPDKLFSELYKQVGHVQVRVNEKIDIRKRYKKKIEGTGDEIDCLDFFKVEDPVKGLLAWGWYAVTPFSKQIPITDLSRGIRLRKFNIQLGTSDTLNNLFSEARGNFYFYGEVFVVHPNLIPNSDRSGLAPTPESVALFSQLRKIFKELHNLYHLASKAKSAAKKVSDAVSKSQLGLETDTKHIQTEINSAEQELGKVEKKAATEVAKRVVELHRNKAKEDKESLQEKSKSDSVTEKTYSTSPENANILEESPGLFVQRSIPNEKKSVENKDVKGDLFEPLKKVLTEKEVFLVRRVFGYMTQACSEMNKEYLEQLKKIAVKKLANE